MIAGLHAWAAIRSGRTVSEHDNTAGLSSVRRCHVAAGCQEMRSPFRRRRLRWATQEACTKEERKFHPTDVIRSFMRMRVVCNRIATDVWPAATTLIHSFAAGGDRHERGELRTRSDVLSNRSVCGGQLTKGS